MTTQRWTTHSDGVDDLLAVTLPVGTTGTRSPTTSLSGPAAPSNLSYYYHTDHQGSVRAITTRRAVTNAYAYDSYGTAEELVESLAQRFRYTGREYDALTGLYHYRARAYDPQTARFLQEDPLWFDAGDLNVYRMTWNNPVNWTDPSGKFAGVEYGKLTQRTTVAVIGGVTVRLSLMQITRLAATREGTVVLYRLARAGRIGALAGTSAAVACNFWALAEAVAVPSGYSVGARTTCGYDYVPNDAPDKPPLTDPQPQPDPKPKPGPGKPLPPPAPAPGPRPDPIPDGPQPPQPRGDGPDDDNNCPLPPLYRAINMREISWRTNGIYSTVQGRETSIVDHILQEGDQLPDGTNPSSWISTTKDLAVAEGYSRGIGFGGSIVKVNRCKLTASKVVDVSLRDNGDARANDFARNAEKC